MVRRGRPYWRCVRLTEASGDRERQSKGQVVVLLQLEEQHPAARISGRLTGVGTRPCSPVRVAGPAGWAGPNRRKIQLHTAARPTPPPLQAYEGSPSPRFDFGTRAERGTAARALSPSPSEITFRSFEPALFHTVLPPIDTFSIHPLTLNTSLWLSLRTPRCVDQSADEPGVEDQHLAVGHSICASTRPSVSPQTLQLAPCLLGRTLY